MSPSHFMSSQVVWARWRGENGRWFPAVVIDQNDGWVGLEPEKPTHEYVLWLGDGRIGQVPDSDLRDFCLAYSECYSNMSKQPKYVNATCIAVKLAAARADEHIGDDQEWQTWALQNMNRFMELSVTSSFYNMLQRKHMEGHDASSSGSDEDDSDIENRPDSAIRRKSRSSPTDELVHSRSSSPATPYDFVPTPKKKKAVQHELERQELPTLEIGPEEPQPSPSGSSPAPELKECRVTLERLTQEMIDQWTKIENGLPVADFQNVDPDLNQDQQEEKKPIGKLVLNRKKKGKQVQFSVKKQKRTPTPELGEVDETKNLDEQEEKDMVLDDRISAGASTNVKEEEDLKPNALPECWVKLERMSDEFIAKWTGPSDNASCSASKDTQIYNDALDQGFRRTVNGPTVEYYSPEGVCVQNEHQLSNFLQSRSVYGLSAKNFCFEADVFLEHENEVVDTS